MGASWDDRGAAADEAHHVSTKLILFAVLAHVFGAGAAQADALSVPAQFATIQPPGDDVDTDAFATALVRTAPRRSLGANTPVRAGATIVEGLVDADYGARGYMAKDPEGHIWYFSN